jgi:endoglucanase
LTGDYILSLTPNKTGTKWVDAPMAVSCVIDPWASAAAATVTGTFGLTLPTGTALTSSSASTTATTSGSAATNGGSGSGGTQTSLAAGTTKTLTPAGGSKNSASGVQVASGLMLGAVLLSMMLL